MLQDNTPISFKKENWLAFSLYFEIRKLSKRKHKKSELTTITICLRRHKDPLIPVWMDFRLARAAGKCPEKTDKNRIFRPEKPDNRGSGR